MCKTPTASTISLRSVKRSPTRPTAKESQRRFRDLSVQRSIEVDLKLMDHYDQLLTDLELYIVRTAKEHDANAFYRLRSVPGIGKILALVILYEIHDINRFATVQDFVSYGRLVKCAKESAGKRHGTSGKKIGNVHLKWAFSEASVLFLRANPKGQKYVDKLSSKHGKAKALSILAHKLGRRRLPHAQAREKL